MDAPEEDSDIKLQKISADLIADFDRSLISFLRKSDSSGRLGVRSRVRTLEATRLATSLLDPFQELPQLLDPHLSKWVTSLSEALLESLRAHRRRVQVQAARVAAESDLLIPLPAAICKLLYTLCKIRGEKVIVRFLSVETKHLELLLSALEEADNASVETWTWEERYIVLLWLSHLLLAPFDLSSISSVGLDDIQSQTIPGFAWPADLPGITIRLLPLAVKYLASPGKERDAAKALLVRMAMRKDMQELGLLDRLVRWALLTLRPNTAEPDQTPYFYIGRLSFLAGILASSSETSDLNPYLYEIYQAVHAVSSEQDRNLEIIVTSALARKTIIKVKRSIAVLVLRAQTPDMAGQEIIESTIGSLLDSLADNDTPVRLAASKALSVITMKLDADMALQVVEAVLQGLNQNVIWTNGASPSQRSRDFRSVNPLDWHGLVLTLSHLLYRRSPPASSLADIVQALLNGLSFEQRNTSGASVGANVRDAACFGVWALARRYTTAELLDVRMASRKSLSASSSREQDMSTIQTLATALVVTASLDPAGNIRRGASAALQELIGRHPDTVTMGISVVQTVDYHAVALRSRAVQEVALSATTLSGQYGEALLSSLLGWRGIGDADTVARRAAAASIGAIASRLALGESDPVARLTHDNELILAQLSRLQDRQAEERHGLLLALAATLSHLPTLVQSDAYTDDASPKSALESFVHIALDGFENILRDTAKERLRRPELLSEAICQLIVAMFPAFQAAVLSSDVNKEAASPLALVAGTDFVSGCTGCGLFDIVAALHSRNEEAWARVRTILSPLQRGLESWLLRPEKDTISAASSAALVILALCTTNEREEVIRKWAEAVVRRPATKVGEGTGYFSALTMSHLILPTLGEKKADYDALISSALVDRWSRDTDIDTRVAILESLTETQALTDNAAQFVRLISEGLDDYTTNARGDVGSHVRLQALKATKTLWRSLDTATAVDLQSFPALFLRVLRLSVEKLDRVRAEAQLTLALALREPYASGLQQSTYSSKKYFRFVLNLLTSYALHLHVADAADGVRSDPERWMQELLAGYVTSADTGNETLVIASRAALSEFCERSPARLAAVCGALAHNLKAREGQDRVVVPTLETIAFLFFTGAFQRCPGEVVDYRTLCLRVQKAHYKTGNVRKIEACVKVYGAIAALDVPTIIAGGEDGSEFAAAAESGRRIAAARDEGRRRLGMLLFHPWPRVRSLVVDELWGLSMLPTATTTTSTAETDRPWAEKLKGTDWGGQTRTRCGGWLVTCSQAAEEMPESPKWFSASACEQLADRTAACSSKKDFYDLQLTLDRYSVG